MAAAKINARIAHLNEDDAVKKAYSNIVVSLLSLPLCMLLVNSYG
jgi:hypothetical protein